MQSQQHIQRLVRELDLPDQADQVIQRLKYWTPGFCWLYFERCDELIFDDAQAGLQAAEFAPELVGLVRKFSRNLETPEQLALRALAVLGSAYRAVGDLEQSEKTYSEALRILDRSILPVEAKANLLFRMAILRCAQDRHDEAVDDACHALKIYRQSSDAVRQRHLGEALTIRGSCHYYAGEFSAAMRDWSEALGCTDPKKKPRIYHSASHNLVFTLVEKTIDSTSLSLIESYLRQARKFLSKRPRSVQKLRVIWLQGLIMVRFGSTRRGEAAFETARRGFIEMEAPFEMALVSLTLGRYLFQSRQISELRALAVETQQIFEALCSDRRANRAIRVWKEAILSKTVSIEAFFAAWTVLQPHVVAPPSRRAPESL